MIKNFVAKSKQPSGRTSIVVPPPSGIIRVDDPNDSAVRHWFGKKQVDTIKGAIYAETSS